MAGFFNQELPLPHSKPDGDEPRVSTSSASGNTNSTNNNNSRPPTTNNNQGQQVSEINNKNKQSSTKFPSSSIQNQ